MPDRHKKFNKFIVVLFGIIIESSLIMWGICSLLQKSFDVPLDGYTDSPEKVEFSGEDYLSGDFQTSFSAMVEQTLPFRGYMVRTYNTIRYELFNNNKGKRVIGKNNSIFEANYLYESNALEVFDYDYSDETRKHEMQNMVNHISSVKNKLEKYGKKLYVYIPPGKSTVYPEDMPEDYVDLREKDSVTASALLKENLDSAGIPYAYCEEYKSQLEYPPFYSTGIHWSRTFEQISSRNIVDDLSRITGKNYRNINIAGIQKSTTPFWRDTDVYELLNIWGHYPDITFYQYDVNVPPRDGYDEMDILLYGDSFSEGFREDILKNVGEAKIAWLSRNDYEADFSGNVISLNKDWNNVSWQYFIDCSDAVVIEMVEPEIINYTFGFIDYLDTFLDTYQPCEKSSYFLDDFDCNRRQFFNLKFVNGIYAMENGYSWIQPKCSIGIKEGTIPEKGLEICFNVTNDVFGSGDEDIVKIYVNGRKVFENTYYNESQEKVFISPGEAGDAENGGYSVEIYSSLYFNPMKRDISSQGSGGQNNISQDNRDLALQLTYLGGAR